LILILANSHIMRLCCVSFTIASVLLNVALHERKIIFSKKGECFFGGGKERERELEIEWTLHVCVCVCVCARERERGRG
jgi:hypothetical protein